MIFTGYDFLDTKTQSIILEKNDPKLDVIKI